AANCAFHKLAPDVVVMDIVLPGTSGLDAMRNILAGDPTARVLMFSMHDDAIFAARALQAGAQGYVSKRSAVDVLIEAVLTVARGERYLSHDIAQTLALRLQEKGLALSHRESDILRLLASGETIVAIASRLQLSEKTVANYQSLLRTKLGATNNIQMLQ